MLHGVPDRRRPGAACPECRRDRDFGMGRLLCVSSACLISGSLIVIFSQQLQGSLSLFRVVWIGMLITVGWVIVSGLLNFNSSVAFSFPPNAFSFSTGFLMGLGSATLYVMYCYLGYYAVCYLGDEVADAPRTIPRSILISVGTCAASF